MIAGLLLAQPWVLRLAKWAAIVIAVLGALLAIRNSGRQAERVDNLQRALDAARRRKDEEIAVGRLGHDAVADELQRDWTRD